MRACSVFLAVVLAAPLALAQDQHIDPNADFHSHSLTIARHTDTAFSLATARDGFVAASRDLQVCNSRIAADQDVATAVSVATSGALGTFGTAGDGGDVITTAAEMTALLAVNSHHIKIVTSIAHCGMPLAGIIGCANTPGSSLTVVRGLSTAVTGETLMHEFGHNKGLNHRDTPGAPFMHTSTLGNNEVNAAEAAAYHQGGTRVGPNRPVDVAFVIDDTGSMGEEIGGVRGALTRHLATFPATACTAFRLNTFKDNVTTRAPTTDLAVIGGQVNGLFASGGGDCPEASVEALDLTRPSVRPDRGRLFLATDADPHPGLDIPAAIQRFRADGIRVDVILTGSCDAGVRSQNDGRADAFDDKPPMPQPGPAGVLQAGADPIVLGDDNFAEVMLPFAFPFGGQVYSTVFVNSNGSVSFGEGSVSRAPSSGELVNGPRRIAAVWMDLNPGAGGTVTGDEVGDAFEITFTDVPIFGGSQVNTFTFVLRPDGTSAVRYGTVEATGTFLAGASIGTGDVPTESDLSALASPIDIDDTAGSVFELFGGDFDLTDETLEFATVETVPPRHWGSVDAYSLLARETGGVFAFLPEVNSGGTSNTTRFENVAFNIVQGGLTQAVSLVEPALGPQGGAVGITLTAAGTNFQPGTTLTVDGAGVNVVNLTVLSPTRLQATLSIAPGAAIGFRDVMVSTDLGGGTVEEAVGEGAFEVTAPPSGPTVLSIQPAEAAQGDALTVRVRGFGTSFSTASALDLGSGVTVSNVRAPSPTVLVADLAVTASSPIGFRNVIVTTEAEVASETLTGPFFVREDTSPTAPAIVSVSPSSVAPDTRHTLQVIAQNTSFADGTSVLSLSGSGIDVLSTTVSSPTALSAEVLVRPDAALGTRDVRVTTGAEVVVLLDALFVTGLAPAAPGLLLPLDGADDVTPTTDLTWEAVDSATGYTAQVATDVAFTDVVATEVVTTTEATVVLDPLTTYFWRVRARNEFGDSPFSAPRSFETTSDVANEGDPTRFALHAAFPNPSQTEVSLHYDVASAAHVRMVMVNVIGQEVAVLVDGARPVGRHTLRLDVSGLPMGVYFVQADLGGVLQTQRLTVAR